MQSKQMHIMCTRTGMYAMLIFLTKSFIEKESIKTIFDFDLLFNKDER